MKTKKNKIYVNKLFSDLIFKNIVSIVIIFLITIGLSFLYNNTLKSKDYSYSIKIFYKAPFALNDKNFLRFSNLDDFNLIGMEYLNPFPNIRLKNIQKDQLGNIDLSFKSNKEIDVSDFIEFINENHKKILLKGFKNEIIKLKKKIEISNDQKSIIEKETLAIFQKLDISLVNIYEIQKILDTLNKLTSSLSLASANQNQLNLIEFYIKNFSTLFVDDIYFSLNGWNIKNNIYNNTEKTFAGILFGILINSILLFFRSNYFKKIF